MSRAGFALLALTMVATGSFVIQAGIHSVYINQTEFVPAQREWEAAHRRGDLDAMWVAYHKEEIAQDHTLDAFWFLRGRGPK